MELPTPKTEPVAYAGALTFLAGLIVAFAAKHGVVLDPAIVAGGLGSLALILIPIVRRLVHPAVKVEAQIGAARAEGMAIGAARGPS